MASGFGDDDDNAGSVPDDDAGSTLNYDYAGSIEGDDDADYIPNDYADSIFSRMTMIFFSRR